MVHLNIKYTYKAILIGMAFLCGTVRVQAQAVGGWHVLNGKYSFNNKWYVFAEGQLRSQRVANDFYYYELKSGVGYYMTPHASVLMGVGQYGTYQSEGSFASPMRSLEKRVWEQLTLTDDIGALKLEHRYRIEQRFIQSTYRNRFRYRLSAMLPTNKQGMHAGGLYVNAYTEVFLTNTKPHFERQRFYAGAGFVFTNFFTWQLGYTRQYDLSAASAGTYKDYITSMLLFDLNHLRKQKQ